MNKYISLLFLFFLYSLNILSQDVVEKSVSQAVEFLDGGDIYQDWFMEVFVNGYKDIIYAKWNSFTGISISIAGACSMIYFSSIAYKMIADQQPIKILPLLKPFGFLMIILNWYTLISIITVPIEYLTKQASSNFYESVQETNHLRVLRYKYQKSVSDVLFKEKAEAQIATDAADKTFWDNAVEVVEDLTINKLMMPLLEYRYRLEISVQLLVSQTLETVSLWILRVCVYLIFIMQIIYSAVLIILGPITVALTILPNFRDAFNQWLARFISVQFYGVISFLVLDICNSLQKQALMMEIDRYSKLINISGATPEILSMENILFFQSSGLLTYGMVIVAFLTTAVCILQVPKITTWIVTTGGSQGEGILNSAVRAGKVAATKGATLLK